MFAKFVVNHFNILEIWSAMSKPNILMSKKYFVTAVEKTSLRIGNSFVPPQGFIPYPYSGNQQPFPTSGRRLNQFTRFGAPNIDDVGTHGGEHESIWPGLGRPEPTWPPSSGQFRRGPVQPRVPLDGRVRGHRPAHGISERITWTGTLPVGTWWTT